MSNPVKEAREKLGLNQVQMAERLGLSQPTISRYENFPEQVDKRTLVALKGLGKK